MHPYTLNKIFIKTLCDTILPRPLIKNIFQNMWWRYFASLAGINFHFLHFLCMFIHNSGRKLPMWLLFWYEYAIYQYEDKASSNGTWYVFVYLILWGL